MGSESHAIAMDLKKKISGEVFCDDISRMLFSTDASMYQIQPLGIVVPKNVDDVIETVRYCSARHIPITCRGAGTSLAGQSIGNGIILVFNKYFKKILGVNETEQTADIQPGVVLSELNASLRGVGLMFGADPSTGNQCALGGMIGTNAAGPHSVKYGATKDNILGLKIVTADGELHTISPSFSESYLEADIGRLLSPYKELIERRFPRTSKNSSGYNLRDTLSQIQDDKHPSVNQRPQRIDLTKLICGSEGTLGIVVEAKAKLVPVPKGRKSLIAYFPSYESCAIAAKESLWFQPSAVEMLDKTFANAALGRDPNMDEILKQNFTSIIIFEFDELEPGIAEEKATKLSEHLSKLSLSHKQVLPRDQKEAAKLWRIRKEASATLYKIEKPGKKTSFVEDVAVPVQKLPVYLEEAQRIFKSHNLSYALYGHAGDGNTHAILLIDHKNKKHLGKIDLVAQEIYDLAISLGGTFSAEHGDGLLRTPYLSKLYGNEVYSLFKKVKDIFDPKGILNPGKIVGEQSTSIVHDLRYGENYKRIKTETSLDKDSLAHEIEKCHGCGVCLSYCPTALATFDERATPRAKGNLLRGIISGYLSSQLMETQEFKDILDYCFNCKLCLTECPTQIDIPGIVIEAKTIFFQRKGKTNQDKFIDRLPVLSAAASITPTFANLVSRLKSVRKLLEKFFGIESKRTLPLFHKPLYKHFRINRNTTPFEDKEVPEPQRKVIYFSGCFANFNDVRGEGISTIEVLRRNKVEVKVLDTLRCCGVARITTGGKNEILQDVSWNIEQLQHYIGQGFDIVFSAPSCALAVKEDYPELIGTENARRVAEHSYELSDYLWRLHQAGKLNTKFGHLRRRVTYHNPCHSIPLGVREQPVELMRLIPGLDIAELDKDTCCGMAGTFGLKKQFYDLSMKVGINLFKQIREAKVDTVITTCGTCNIQILQGTQSKVEHLASILLESYKRYDGTKKSDEDLQNRLMRKEKSATPIDSIIE
jgi:anaerobic glycerol-3-phosphate dehydrogenase C subunit